MRIIKHQCLSEKKLTGIENPLGSLDDKKSLALQLIAIDQIRKWTKYARGNI